MKKFKTLNKTSFLVEDNSFIKGVESVFNIAGNFFEYNTSNTGAEADKKALTSDWLMVGNDLKNASKKFKSKNKQLCYK